MKELNAQEQFDNVKKFLERVGEENIKFKKHFYEKTGERPVSENLVRGYLRKTERLLKVEKQKSKRAYEEKYKLWLKLSNKYALVVIAAVSKKDLYIITAWNINRKWQKLIKK